MVVETQSLTKYYGEKLGCRDITLSVGAGEVFGFLGPNGAGKSTFVKMLTGLLFPTSGYARILSRPPGNIEARRKLGYLPENFKYQEWMTGADLLSFHASLYKLDKRTAGVRIEETLDLVKLKGNEKYKIGTYSKGMQQRLGMASALLPDPQLLFLDEPTSALDPIGRKEVREIIAGLKTRGKTIFLNSHLLSEIEMICDSAAIISKGRLLRKGSMEELTEGKTIVEIRAEGLSGELIQKLKGVATDLTENADRISASVGSREDIHKLAAIIIENGGRLYELKPRRESLENVFISLIERGDGE